MIVIYILPQKLSSFTDIYPNTQGSEKIKKISTHLLTVLPISVILQLEQGKRKNKRTEAESRSSNLQTI